MRPERLSTTINFNWGTSLAKLFLLADQEGASLEAIFNNAMFLVENPLAALVLFEPLPPPRNLPAWPPQPFTIEFFFTPLRHARIRAIAKQFELKITETGDFLMSFLPNPKRPENEQAFATELWETAARARTKRLPYSPRKLSKPYARKRTGSLDYAANFAKNFRSRP